jgi:hypothetical protein
MMVDDRGQLLEAWQAAQFRLAATPVRRQALMPFNICQKKRAFTVGVSHPGELVRASHRSLTTINYR